MKFILKINKGVLPFNIGTEIKEYLSSYSYEFFAGEIGEIWDEYNFFDSTIEVYVNKSSRKIETICCRHNCYLNDVNLIDLDIECFFVDFPGSKYGVELERIFLTDEEQDVYDIDSLGLQLWVNDSGKIVTVFVSNYQ